MSIVVKTKLYPIMEHSYSFPSAHAMLTMALAASVVSLLWNTRWRRLSLLVGILYVFFSESEPVISRRALSERCVGRMAIRAGLGADCY